jgi:hypothetical protein
MAEDGCDLLCLDLERAEALRRSRLSVEHAQRASDAARGSPTRRG